MTETRTPPQLAAAVGTWQGTEKLAPAPWAPEGMTASGRTAGRAILGGYGIASEYTQRAAGVEGPVTLRAHTVIRWDPDADRWSMHFFAGPGAPPMAFEGRAQGTDTLVFESSTPDGGRMRQTFVYGTQEMTVRSESRGVESEGAERSEVVADEDSDGWSLSFEGRYRRIGGSGEEGGHPPGTLGWTDLTVGPAEELRDFYAAVIGWEPEAVKMSDAEEAYADYNMRAPGRGPVAGVCHARGSNASLPPQWLNYWIVADVNAAVSAAEERGGELIGEIRTMGSGNGTPRFAVIRDPAGACVALYQP